MALVTAALEVAPSAAVAGPTSIQVTGYADDSTRPSVVTEQAKAVTDVGVDGVVLNGNADGVSAPSSGALDLEARAHALGLKAELLVSNFDDAGDASPARATHLLHSASNRRAVAADLVAIVTSEHWDGLTVDLESLARSDESGLVEFLALLRQMLPATDSLSVDVSAMTSLGAYEAGGYDLGGLAAQAMVVIMAYDEDGPWSGPGPIGGLPWQRTSVLVALRKVPARRLILGVPAYGYTWPPGKRVHDGVTISARRARELAAAAGVSPRWVGSAGEWTVRLKDGTVCWWADVRSFRLRAAMARSMSLAGLAVWQLSSSDQLPSLSADQTAPTASDVLDPAPLGEGAGRP